MEIWKDIKWYEWIYQISNFGRVKSLSRKHSPKEIILKPYIQNKWYFLVKLQIQNIIQTLSVHRLVWQAFLWLNLIDIKTFVCHKDDNPKNNHVDNLFLWTRSDNMIDCSKKWRLTQWQTFKWVIW